MEARLTQLNYNEILLYLGYRGQDCPPELAAQIRRCMDEVTQAAEARLVYRILPCSDGAVPGLPLGGRDIRNLLSSCRKAVLMAVTLGPRVERLLMRREVSDMADAVILDACASTAVENVCGHFESDLREELSRDGLFLTDRFSPGYGDLPLGCQSALCGVLNAERRIGLTVTDRSLLVPRKSVTAILGISDVPQKLRARGCEVCRLFSSCPYRREGTHCPSSSPEQADPSVSADFPETIVAPPSRECKEG